MRVQLGSDLAEAEALEELKRRRGLAEEALAISKDLRRSQLPVHLATVITEIEELIDDLARAGSLPSGWFDLRRVRPSIRSNGKAGCN